MSERKTDTNCCDPTEWKRGGNVMRYLLRTGNMDSLDSLSFPFEGGHNWLEPEVCFTLSPDHSKRKNLTEWKRDGNVLCYLLRSGAVDSLDSPSLL